MDNECKTTYWTLCQLMRDLSEGRLREPTSAFRCILDEVRKHGEPSGMQLDIVMAYICMLGQLARQMQSVTLPDLIRAHTDFMRLSCSDNRSRIPEFGRILDRVDQAAQMMMSEICFRLPDDPRLNYPPHPEFLPDEDGPTFDQMIADFVKQTQVLKPYVNAFRINRPLGKDESAPFDTRTLADFLAAEFRKEGPDSAPEDEPKDAKRVFNLAVDRLKELKSTVRDLLTEAVAYAKRHRSAHLSACCDLQREFDAGRRHHDFAKRLQQMLDDLWQEAVTMDKGTGNGAGRKKSLARTDQVEKGAEKKRANPERSCLSIAREVLMTWKEIHGAESAAQGYANDEKGIKLLAGAIDRFLKEG